MNAVLARLVRRFALLAILTVVGAVAGGVYGAVKTPVFRAQAYVVFTADPGEPTAAVSFAQAYGRLVTSGPIVDAAAATLGSRKDLSTVTGSTSPDAPVVEITATAANANRAADVANAVAKALVDHATARKPATRVSASILASATVPATPTSPRPPLELVVGAAAGALLGALATLSGVGRPRERPQPLPPPPPPLAIAWAATDERRVTLLTENEVEGHLPNVAEPVSAPATKVIGRAVVIRQELR